MTTMASICARGGSKGVPGKNMRRLLGRPLIAYTIEQALKVPEIDGVYVSTDSEAIAEIAIAEGATVLGLRPAHLATDSAPKIPVIENLVETVEATGTAVDRIVDLDPTSPLRAVDDIHNALRLLTPDVDVVITGYLSDKNPYFNMVEDDGDGWFGLVKPPTTMIAGRQSAPAVYAMNASIYCWHRATLSRGLWSGKVRFLEMPRERSIDIDHEMDWLLVEHLLKERNENAA
jgi:CMP-N,N'-diacetyllegionaminic acid synthase